jgi:hypothetical protein
MSRDLPGAFVPSVPRPPDPFSVDLEALGVELSPEASAAIAADPALAAERAELAALEAWWVRAGPPLVAPPPVVAAPARRWPVLLGGVALFGALAASLLLAIEPSGPDPQGVLVQARGGLDVAVVPMRAGVPLEAGEPLRPGDEIDVRIVAEERGQVAIATVSGLVAGAAVDAGAAYRPPGRVRLDGYSGAEWLVVWVGAAVPAGHAEIQAAARALLPDPLAAASTREDIVAYEITRGEVEPQ